MLANAMDAWAESGPGCQAKGVVLLAHVPRVAFPFCSLHRGVLLAWPYAFCYCMCKVVQGKKGTVRGEVQAPWEL